MTDDLVKRLDQALHFENWTPVPDNFSQAVPLLRESRNRIEELETENATLKQMWWDAGDVTDLAGTIAELEAKLRKSALQELSALGQASEAYQAQLAAEAKLELVIAAYRIEAMRRDDYSHDAFDQHIAALKGDTP